MKRGPKPIVKIIGNTKRCQTCKEFKPFDQYQKLRRSDCGLQHACRECQNKRLAQYRKKTEGAYWKSKGKYTVYSLISPDGFVYIGHTSTDPYLRYQRHKANAKNADTWHQLPLLFNSFREHGMDAHIFRIVAEFDNKQESVEVEDKWIRIFQDQDISLNIIGALARKKK